jgi:biopolymer transport protein ExbD
MKKLSISIELTPLVDVVLLLLLFFLLSSTFFVQQRIELAKAKEREGVKQKVVVTIDKDGFIYLGKELVSLKSLTERLSGMRDKAVVIAADKEALHGVVVLVMDRIRAAGFKKLFVATR